jgi:plasmid stabilization system protein ParE
MKIVVHPEAERDLEEATAFYEREGSAILAARFVAEFKQVGELLVEHPGVGVPRAHGLRGFAMSVFPYSVIYRVSADLITILVVKHDRKHPGYGGKRS